MPEANQTQPQSQNPQIAQQSQKATRNWKKALLFLLIGLFAISLMGVGLYLLVPRLTEEPPSSTQKQATPSAKKTKQVVKKYKLLFNYEEEISENNYTNGIYLLDPEGTTPEKILDNPDYKTPNNSQFVQLKLSPDNKYLGWIKAGKKIIFFEYGKVDLKNKEITSIQSFTDSDSGYLSFFEWSESGDQVALYLSTGNGPYTWTVKIIDISTGKISREFQMGPKNGDAHPVNFSWVGDKFYAIFVKTLPLVDKFTSGGEDYIISSYSIDGKKEFEKKIYSSKYRPEFDISDDGKNLAFVKVFGSSSRYRGELWYSNIDGSKLAKVADTPILDCTNGRPLDISPNKKWIVVGSGCADGTGGVIVNLESKNVIKTDIDIGNAIWSPNSQQIWMYERLFSQSDDPSIPSSPISSANYIVNTKGEVVKEFESFGLYAVWYLE